MMEPESNQQEPNSELGNEHAQGNPGRRVHDVQIEQTIAFKHGHTAKLKAAETIDGLPIREISEAVEPDGNVRVSKVERNDTGSDLSTATTLPEPYRRASDGSKKISEQLRVGETLLPYFNHANGKNFVTVRNDESDQFADVWFFGTDEAEDQPVQVVSAETSSVWGALAKSGQHFSQTEEMEFVEQLVGHVVQKKGHQDGVGVVLAIDSTRAVTEGTAHLVAESLDRVRSSISYDSVWLCSTSTGDAWRVG